jgi:PAS domain S-box-containing protein
MSLRLKSLLLFSVAVALLFGIVVVLLRTLIERQFTDIELDRIHQQAARLPADLQGELNPVTTLVSDWAPWTELYDFVDGADPAFPDVNLSDATMTNLHLDFFAFYRQDGSLVLLKTTPGQLAANGITENLLLDAIRREQLVPQESIDVPAAGLMLAGERVVLIAALPIVHSDRTGPPVGTIVGGRIFGQQEIERFEKFGGYKLRLITRPNAPDDTTPQPQSNSDIVVRIVDEQTISATVPIFDTKGNIIADAELLQARPLHLQAARTIRIFMIVLASSGGILLFVVWYLLDANVIHPVRRLADQLARAATEGRLPSGLDRSGGHELADLAQNIESLSASVAKAEANYRAIVEDQTEFIFRYLPNGRTTFVNDAFCRYFGRPPEEFLGGDAHHFIAEEDIGRVLSALDRLSPAAPVVILDHRVRTPGGGVAWFRRNDRALFSADGKLRELQCVARDFTQTHLTRERLEASEARYRRLFETAADGILIVRQSSRLVADANPELCRLLDCDRSALVDRSVESVPAFASSKTERTLAKLLDGSQPMRRVEIALFPDESDHRHLEVTSGIYEAGGETIVQLNFRDISLRKRANDELRQLSGQLLRLQDEERRRIARELHDSTAQNLSALQMAVTQIDAALPDAPPKTRRAIEEIRTLTDLSLREVRTISYLLHPPLLDEVGLLFALRWYVDGFMTRTEKIVHLEMPETLERLSSEIETTIFRIVQEGLTNVHRHSGSRRAWIRLALDERSVELEIRDEGCGIPPSADGVLHRPILGVGIAGMRERLRQFNGSLAIESSSGGTTVRATIPIDLDDPDQG